MARGIAVALALAGLAVARAGFNDGSGIMLTVPPMGSVGDISGRVWGLPGPLTNYRVRGRASESRDTAPSTVRAQREHHARSCCVLSPHHTTPPPTWRPPRPPTPSPPTAHLLLTTPHPQAIVLDSGNANIWCVGAEGVEGVVVPRRHRHRPPFFLRYT